jgi:hypothetical protein
MEDDSILGEPHPQLDHVWIVEANNRNRGISVNKT